MFRSACAPRTMERCENLCPSPGAASGVDAPAIPALPSASAPSCTLWSNTISSTIGFSLLPPPCPHRFQCDAPLFAPFFYLTHFFLQVLPCAWLLRRLSRECRLAIADAATLKSLAALVPPTGEHVVRYSGVVFGGGVSLLDPSTSHYKSVPCTNHHPNDGINNIIIVNNDSAPRGPHRRHRGDLRRRDGARGARGARGGRGAPGAAPCLYVPMPSPPALLLPPHTHTHTPPLLNHLRSQPPHQHHQICTQLWLASSLLSDALAVAAQSLVARSLAAGEVAAARRVVARTVAWGAALGCAMAAALAAAGGGGALQRLFTADAGALGLAGGAVWAFVVATQPINSLAFVWDGVLFGCGGFRFACGAMAAACAPAVALMLLLARGAASPGAALAGVWAGLALAMALRWLTVWLPYRAGWGPFAALRQPAGSGPPGGGAAVAAA